MVFAKLAYSPNNVRDARKSIIDLVFDINRPSIDGDHVKMTVVDHDHVKMTVVDHDHVKMTVVDHDHIKMSVVDHDHVKLTKRASTTSG
uniref:Uncharacterized protein n=1 Tax=Meloidogyne incognita TaxID=6306 RepID=A0A914MUT8_MELIC